ncbi:hypothetical protein Egran_05345 [Elaphomyces granulatus]|uniref:NADAR domain-containing protein n=1 Tax=Elaphomyces granulatus TaxID=519963 RepID=A0A232LS82_9EURO|nr:hypothetical protein Egran_05345 [Elaphomyces granulatus]
MRKRSAPTSPGLFTMDPRRNGPVYFWRPGEANGFLGQWYTSPFIWKRPLPSDGKEYEELKYENAEHFMMHRKALLFAPEDTITKKILSASAPAPHPRSLRMLGRKVPNFSNDVWVTERYTIVLEGSYLKFTQNDNLKRQLLDTGTRELVEASPRDRIWGIGFGKGRAGSVRKRWGLNLLGKALVETRGRIRMEEGIEVVERGGGEEERKGSEQARKGAKKGGEVEMGTVVDEEREVKGGKEVEPKRKRKRTKNQTKQNKSAD